MVEAVSVKQYHEIGNGDTLGTGKKKLRLSPAHNAHILLPKLVGELIWDLPFYISNHILCFILFCFWNRLLLKPISSYL